MQKDKVFALGMLFVKQLTGNAQSLRQLGWSCDGKRLATGSADMTVRIWQPDRADCELVTFHVPGIV